MRRSSGPTTTNSIPTAQRGFSPSTPQKMWWLICEQANGGGLYRLTVKILPLILGWADGRARRIRSGPSGREWRAALCTWDWAWSARRGPSRPWSRRAACWTRDAGQPFGSFPCTFLSNLNGTRPDDDAKVPKSQIHFLSSIFEWTDGTPKVSSLKIFSK